MTSAALRMTGMGIYEAYINGRRVSEDVLAPGWTAYMHRLQVQTYDVTDLWRLSSSSEANQGLYQQEAAACIVRKIK